MTEREDLFDFIRSTKKPTAYGHRMASFAFLLIKELVLKEITDKISFITRFQRNFASSDATVYFPLIKKYAVDKLDRIRISLPEDSAFVKYTKLADIARSCHQGSGLPGGWAKLAGLRMRCF